MSPLRAADEGHGQRGRRHEVGLDIRRYRCRPCRAVVQVLPAFVARSLWRLWRTVESAVMSPERIPWTVVPERTLRRWRERVMLAARAVLLVLSSLRTPALDELVAAIGLDATRRALLVAFRPLAGVVGALAALTVLLGKARHLPRRGRLVCFGRGQRATGRARTGEPGVGKTSAMRHLCRLLPGSEHRVVYLCDCAVKPLDLYRMLAAELGRDLVPARRSSPISSTPSSCSSTTGASSPSSGALRTAVVV